VNINDLYDLASVTKVAATVPALMKMKEDGLIDTDDKLSKYLTYLKDSDKKNMIINDVLLHQAGC